MCTYPEQKAKTSLAFLIVLVFTSTVSAQSFLQAGLGVGIASPQADYEGGTVSYYWGTKYGLSTGYNVHGKVRAFVLGVRLVSELSYSSFNNTGVAIPASPIPEAPPQSGHIDVNQNIVSIKLGTEYGLALPFTRLTSYFGGHASVNILNGNAFFQGADFVPNGKYTMQSAVRGGLGGTVGLTYDLATLMNLDIAAHFDAINLFGRKWEDLRPNDTDRFDSYLSLNDESDPLFSQGSDLHFVNARRNIQVLHFTVTLMFGL